MGGRRGRRMLFFVNRVRVFLGTLNVVLLRGLILWVGFRLWFSWVVCIVG